MTAAEVGLKKPQTANWVDYAINVWNTQALRLDYEEKNGTCGGGLRWQIFSLNNGYDYKKSLTNGNFFRLSARLARCTGNATYLQYADNSFKWASDVGIIGKDFRMFDGMDINMKSQSINHLQWTANHGIYTKGAAIMHNMTGAQNWTDAVKGFVNAFSVFQAKDSSILVGVACENTRKYDTNQRVFKGVFARSFARAALAGPIIFDSINRLLSASAKAAAGACSGGEDPTCGFR